MSILVSVNTQAYMQHSTPCDLFAVVINMALLYCLINYLWIYKCPIPYLPAILVP